MDVTVTHLLAMDRLIKPAERVAIENCFVVHRDYSFLSAMERNKRSRNLPKWQKLQLSI
jgi:hypothetical protein